MIAALPPCVSSFICNRFKTDRATHGFLRKILDSCSNTPCPVTFPENHVRFLVRFSIISVVAVCVSACGPTNSTRSTFDGPHYAGPALNKFLVIGIAGDFNSRADFERLLAKEISANSSSATAYYTLVDMDAPIDRESVLEQVRIGTFDAVLVTRVLNRDVGSEVKVGSSATKKTRQDGGIADLFRYDYEELNEPARLSMEISVIIEVEVFSAILETVELVSRELRRDGLVN
jgi:hypothetical protein